MSRVATGGSAEARPQLTREELRAQSEFVGSVGDVIVIDRARVNFASPVQSKFADKARFVYGLVDENRNAIRIFGSLPVQVGQRYRLTGIVDKTEEYNGEKQTYLKQVRVLGTVL